MLQHGHKKRKDSLKTQANRVDRRAYVKNQAMLELYQTQNGDPN